MSGDKKQQIKKPLKNILNNSWGIFWRRSLMSFWKGSKSPKIWHNLSEAPRSLFKPFNGFRGICIPQKLLKAFKVGFRGVYFEERFMIQKDQTKGFLARARINKYYLTVFKIFRGQETLFFSGYFAVYCDQWYA